MSSSLVELPWHDAVLLDLRVDRNNPGINDCITLVIGWQSGGKSEIKFLECYVANFKLNFGILAKETIRDFSVISNGPEVESIHARLTSFGPLVNQLKLYRLETNSTASIIEIVALDVIILD